MEDTNPDSIKNLIRSYSKINDCTIFSNYDPASLKLKLYMKKNGKSTERTISSLDCEDSYLIALLNEMHKELIDEKV